MIFTRKRNSLQINLRLNNKTLSVYSSAKFLGLIFDYKLSWKEFLRELKKRSMATINILKILSNRRFGPSSSRLKTLDPVEHLPSSLLKSFPHFTNSQPRSTLWTPPRTCSSFHTLKSPSAMYPYQIWYSIFHHRFRPTFPYSNP